MSSLGRSVSTRLPAKKDHKEPSSRPPSAQWSGPSHIATFLRVLRLLNLDCLDDWPAISESTFSGRVANLQQCIKATEWALYRLFEIWDPPGTQERLKPFFPPLAPLQSRNLRAALFRCLSDLKKDGILGKEITLRKTMLDECKGDKFEEILGCFAIIVLRKITSEARSRHNHMEAVALAPPGQISSMEEELLLPKILAQRYALQRIVREKEEILVHSRNRQNDFKRMEDSIVSVKREVQQQREEILNLSDSEHSKADQAASTLTSSWQGDLGWVDQILMLPNSRNADLSAPTMGHHEAMRPTSLLQDLEQRVVNHQNRLEEWKAYRVSLEQNTSKSEEKSVRRDHKVGGLFDKHQILTLSSTETDPDATGIPVSGFELYTELSKSLRESIAAIKQGPNRRNNTLTGDTSPSAHDPESRKVNKGTTQPTSRVLPAKGLPPNMSAEAMAPKAMGRDITPVNSSPAQPSNDQLSTREVLQKKSPQDETFRNSVQMGVSSHKVPISSSHSTSPSLQAQEDTPSATSPHQSKTASGDSNGLDTKAVETPETPKTPSLILETPSEAGNGEKTANRLPIATLLERTRQSMSLLPNPPSRNEMFSTARTRTKSQQRQSHARPSMLGVHPVNPWETPKQKSLKGSLTDPQSSPQLPPNRSSEYSIENNITSSIGVQSTSSTPRADLFSDDADYESVFKSRPRIKMSPTPSPERSGIGMGISWGIEEDNASN